MFLRQHVMILIRRLIDGIRRGQRHTPRPSTGFVLYITDCVFFVTLLFLLDNELCVGKVRLPFLERYRNHTLPYDISLADGRLECRCWGGGPPFHKAVAIAFGTYCNDQNFTIGNLVEFWRSLVVPTLNLYSVQSKSRFLSV